MGGAFETRRERRAPPRGKAGCSGVRICREDSGERTADDCLDSYPEAASKVASAVTWRLPDRRQAMKWAGQRPKRVIQQITASDSQCAQARSPAARRVDWSSALDQQTATRCPWAHLVAGQSQAPKRAGFSFVSASWLGCGAIPLRSWAIRHKHWPCTIVRTPEPSEWPTTPCCFTRGKTPSEDRSATPC
jgi:hypothetical protein